MPAIITHYSYCINVMRNKDSIYKNATILGSQGPDPFFFYGQIPWKKRKHKEDVNSYGMTLHHMDITDTYLALMDYANNGGEDKELLWAFIEGLLIHYSMDRNCHPFIFAKSGFTDKEEDKKLWSLSHMWYETLLDNIIGKKYGTLTIYAGEKYLKIDNKMLLKISKMWEVVNKKVHVKDNINEKAFYQSVHDYKTAMKITNVPHGFSFWFTKHIMGDYSQSHRMNIPLNMPKMYENIDFLNIEHKQWPNCVTGEMRTESFLDLWDKAEKDYKDACILIDKAKNGVDISKEFKEYIANIDHDGFEPEQKMIYQDVVWEWPEKETLKKAS